VGSFDSSGGYFSGPELSTSSPHEQPGVVSVAGGGHHERTSFESDELEGLAEDRVVAQGYLLCLKNVSGVRQWKRRWVVLRGRSLTLYKNFEVPPTPPFPLSSFALPPHRATRSSWVCTLAKPVLSPCYVPPSPQILTERNTNPSA
jgi:hypothetical protein